MRYSFILLAIFFISAPTIAQAQNTPVFAKITQNKAFQIPIDCQLEENCHIMNYVDMGPDDGKNTDPACFNRTYDTHKGTDIAILDGKAMETGVNVLAPMEGIVSKIRDGEPDQWSTPEQIEEIKQARKECGNAIMIDHGDGLQTLYCHLKKGSIAVKPKQKIKIGDVIAQVGLSGFTEFPHLHFGILQDNKIIDPFTGQNNEGHCGKRIKSLWDNQSTIQYQPFAIQSAGFLDDVPDLKDLERDNNQKQSLSVDSDKITFWVILLGVREGDEISLEIKDPNGKIFASNKIIQDKTRARQFYFIGKNNQDKDLIEGAYTGLIKLTRKMKNGNDITKDKIVSALIIK